MAMASEAVIRGSFAAINTIPSRLETDLRACKALVLKIPPMSAKTELEPSHDEVGTMFLQTIPIACEAERWPFISLQATSSSTEIDARIELGVFPNLDRLDSFIASLHFETLRLLDSPLLISGTRTHIGWQGVCASLTKLYAVLPELDHLSLAIGIVCSEHTSHGARITRSASDRCQES
jgi:hypothetical protein